ncbi:TrmH family RNA methyltransferase [Acetobacteroides hydrogenigenes]|nr:RNA methyltransferase [Acetobacteroides hydrogenigenes]
MEFTPEIRNRISDHLETFLGDERIGIIKRVLSNRTRYITVCLEDIYQSQNASAVLRSSEAFGLQDVHIIENSNIFSINPNVVRGSDKWLTIHRYFNSACPTSDAISSLRSNGYRIVATSPHVDGVALEDFDLTKGKVAVFFGNEHNGVSQTLLDQADEYLYIPMYGFTESFNISVAAAMTIHTLRGKLHEQDIRWALSGAEYEELLFSWLNKAVKRPDLIVKRFLDENPY